MILDRFDILDDTFAFLSQHFREKFHRITKFFELDTQGVQLLDAGIFENPLERADSRVAAVDQDGGDFLDQIGCEDLFRLRMCASPGGGQELEEFLFEPLVPCAVQVCDHLLPGSYALVPPGLD